MIHVHPSRPYQLRRACDRCHKSKLRCLRNDDDDACQRCLQAGAACSSSPASRPQRHAHRTAVRRQSTSTSQLPTQQAIASSERTERSEPSERADKVGRVIGGESVATTTTATDFAPNHLLTFHDQAFDHLFLLDGELDSCMTNMDDSNAMNQPHLSTPVSLFGHSRSDDSSSSRANNDLSSSSTAVDVHLGSHLALAPHPLSPADDKEPPSLAHYMSKMSEVGLELMKHLATIPQPGPEVNAEQLLAGPVSKCPIDQVFQLTEVFVEILESILLRLPPPFTGMPPDRDAPLPPDRLSLDASSELLIFSSYLRLIEIYDRILRHMELHCRQRQHCSTLASASICSTASSTIDLSADTGAQRIDLPGWSIGSFSVSAKSKTQQHFMIHLIETMLSRASDLVTNITCRKGTYGYRGNWECFGGMSLAIVPDLALQAIRAREKASQRLVQNIKTALRS